MGTAIKHPVPDRAKPSFVIFDIRHTDAQCWTSECPDVKNYKWRLNLVWHSSETGISSDFSYAVLACMDKLRTKLTFNCEPTKVIEGHLVRYTTAHAISY